MEADLHAIVRPFEYLKSGPITDRYLLDPIPTTSLRCTLPVLHLSDSLRPEIHPLCKCPSPRSQTRKLTRQRRLRTQNLRFWFS